MIPFLFCSIRFVVSTDYTDESAQSVDGFLSCCTLRCRHERSVLATFDPLQNFRHAPDRKRMAQPGGDHIRPETIQSFLVVDLLEVACLREKLIVIDARSEGAAAQFHHGAADHVCVLCDEQGSAVA